MSEELKAHFKKMQIKPSERVFAKIYQQSCLQLYGVVLRILRDESRAQECMQEIYVKIWQSINSYNEDKASPMTWMSRIAKNHCIDLLRKSNLVIYDDYPLTTIKGEAIEQHTILDNNARKKQLHICLKQLKPTTLDVFILAYFKGLTYQEIANIKQQPVATIKTWVYRAMPILKKCLKQ